MDLAAHYLADVILQFEKMKTLADRAIAQVSDDELFEPPIRSRTASRS